MAFGVGLVGVENELDGVFQMALVYYYNTNTNWPYLGAHAFWLVRVGSDESHTRTTFKLIPAIEAGFKKYVK